MKLIKHCRTPRMKSAVLIEGLPGIGNVARICADYLIDKLKARKIFSLYSTTLPNYIFIDEDNFAEMPCIEFYHAFRGDKDLVFVVGDVQPMDDSKSHELAAEILGVCEKLGVKTIITLGGIGLKKEAAKIKVHAAVTDESFIKDLKKCGAVFEGNRTVSVIVGAAGILLGWGQVDGLKGFSLLAETQLNPGHVGIRPARQVLKVLLKYLDVKVSLAGLDKEIKEFEKFSKGKMRALKRTLPKKNLQYIG